MSFGVRRVVRGFCEKCAAEVPTKRAAIRLVSGEIRVRRVCKVHGIQTVNLNPWSNAKPKRDVTGKLRASTKEADRGNWLLAASKAGTITNLVLCNDHPRKTYRFSIYGTQAVEDLLNVIEAHKPGSEVDRHLTRLAQDVRRSKRALHTYTPDFEFDDDKGVHHVEDVKGRKDERYRLNRILMEVCYDITVEEPR